jgi:hypothetical protein
MLNSLRSKKLRLLLLMPQLKLDKPSKKLLPKPSLHQLRPVLMLNSHRLKLFKNLLKLRLIKRARSIFLFKMVLV